MNIIYKFTIESELTYKGQSPFYIGQHISKESVEDFLSQRSKYWGSGKIWLRFIKALKRKHPQNWQSFIKREILFSSESITQKGLDALEEFWIKREKAHYSFGIGGCNVLWGTANKFGSGSPMKDKKVAQKVTNKIRGRKGAKRSEEGRKNISIAAKKSWENADERRLRISILQKRRASTVEFKKKMHKVHIGKKLSFETRNKISEHHADFSGTKHPLWGSTFIWITNGVKNKRHNPQDIIPEGWMRGKLQKKK